MKDESRRTSVYMYVCTYYIIFPYTGLPPAHPRLLECHGSALCLSEMAGLSLNENLVMIDAFGNSEVTKECIAYWASLLLYWAMMSETG
jgi:hypothetical protein